MSEFKLTATAFCCSAFLACEGVLTQALCFQALSYKFQHPLTPLRIIEKIQIPDFYCTFVLTLPLDLTALRMTVKSQNSSRKYCVQRTYLVDYVKGQLRWSLQTPLPIQFSKNVKATVQSLAYLSTEGMNPGIGILDLILKGLKFHLKGLLPAQHLLHLLFGGFECHL